MSENTTTEAGVPADATQDTAGGGKWVLLGVALGFGALLLVPPVLGSASAFCGYKAYSEGRQMAGVVTACWGLASVVLGMILGAFFWVAAL